MQTIMNFNAMQARKRAAAGGDPAPPPEMPPPSFPLMGNAGPSAGSVPGVELGMPDPVLASQGIGIGIGGGGGGGDDGVSERKRKRKSRWGGSDAQDKTFIPGMPTMMPSGLSKDQEEAYLRKSSSMKIIYLKHFTALLTALISFENSFYH